MHGCSVYLNIRFIIDGNKETNSHIGGVRKLLEKLQTNIRLTVIDPIQNMH